MTYAFIFPTKYALRINYGIQKTLDRLVGCFSDLNTMCISILCLTNAGVPISICSQTLTDHNTASHYRLMLYQAIT